MTCPVCHPPVSRQKFVVGKALRHHRSRRARVQSKKSTKAQAKQQGAVINTNIYRRRLPTSIAIAEEHSAADSPPSIADNPNDRGSHYTPFNCSRFIIRYFLRRPGR